jgi:VanZ family protein
MNKTPNTGDPCLLLLSQWAFFFVFCGVIFVLMLTLFPYDFFFAEVIDELNYNYLLSRVERPNNLDDIIANVFLFMPFGFGVGCLTRQFKLTGKIALLVVAVASFGLTFSVEFLQIFLPTRNPSYVDLTTNTIGGVIGFFCFQFFGIQFLKILTAVLSVEKLWRSRKISILLAIVYLSFILYLTVKLPSKSALWQLSDWDVNFPVVVGNELTGDRPWQGKIEQLCFGDRAATEVEVAQLFTLKDSCNTLSRSLIAAYEFDKGEVSYRDRTGNLPDLTWHQNIATEQPTQGVAIHPENWLHTETATVLNEKIKNSSQFTISFIIATNDLKQNGPARIISLSRDIYHRNLTIGQWQNNLSIRLRTFHTGSNGTRPEFIVSNFFSDTQFHHAIATYNGRSLVVYVDNLNNKKLLELMPETTLFWSLAPRFPVLIHLNNFHTIFYRFLYYLLILLPLKKLIFNFTNVS